MNFKKAGKAELLRSSQKDENIVEKLRVDISSVTQSALGARIWLKWKQEIELLADVFYLCATTLFDYQTLGEEYVNVIQVDETERRLPTKLRRFSMILLQVGTPWLLNKLIKSIEINLPAAPAYNSLKPEVKYQLHLLLPKLRYLVSFIHRCHLSLFYLNGVFYHLAKRLTGIHYVLLRSWLKDNTSRPYFYILGILSVTELILWIIFAYQAQRKQSKTFEMEKEIDISSDDGVDPSTRCSLCLEKRINSTATPCGHLFCWCCVVEWVLNKPECPLCRESLTPSRLVCLQNYI